jgi:anaerobic magnesium-protoporphyrin IX monomethyl ester cyclase
MTRVSLVVVNDASCYKFDRMIQKFPLGIAYVAAALEQKDCDVRIFDGCLHNWSEEETANQALSHDPEFIGLGFSTPLFPVAVRIVEFIKRRSPSTVVILGGPHVSALPEASLRNSKADFICIGEGEESAAAIIECVQNNGDPNQLPSTAFRWKGQTGTTRRYRRQVGDRREDFLPPLDINKWPIPARHLFDSHAYIDKRRGLKTGETGALFGRGCPGKCSFCGGSQTLIRWRNIPNIIEELTIIKQMGIRNIFVHDDTYTNNKKRVLDLSNQITLSNLDLHLSIQLRLDQIDRQICDALYSSGVRYVGPGIESGNEDIMRQIGKGPKESKQFIRQQVSLLKEYDWAIRLSYVFGMPEETEAQMMDTIALAKELDVTDNMFAILVPYPDSPLWHVAKDRGLVHDDMDFSKFLFYHEVGVNLSAVANDRLLEIQKYAYEAVKPHKYKTESTVN